MPTWETREKGKKPDRELCRQGDHVWIAVFFESGGLAYWECENCGEKDREYEPIQEQPWLYTDHYWLVRYQVIGADLMRFESHCYEDSTYEIPNASEPKQMVVLSGLRPLADAQSKALLGQ